MSVAKPAFWPGLHLIAALALLLRVATALWSDRVHHADEIFQYLEQAHRLVYGYGYVPWEYRYGVRNWTLAGGFALLLQGLRWLGMDSPAQYVPAVRCVLAALSMSVVYSLYAIGRALYDEGTARLAAGLAAIWYELVYMATLPTPETLCGEAGLAALALLLGRRPLSRRRAVAVGVLLGLMAVLRLQFLPVVGVLFATLWVRAGRRACVQAVAAAMLPLALAGATDAWSWGMPFASIYYNVLYNSVHGVADLFGRMPPMFYVQALAIQSGGIFAAATLAALFDWRRSGIVLLLIGAIVLPHSLIAHKEYRFIFGATGLFVLLTARLCRGLPRAMAHRVGSPHRWLEHGTLATGMALVLLVSAMGALGQLPGQWREGIAFRSRLYQSNDLLTATLDLARRPGVLAIANTRNAWYETGGYYYLHREVPIYFNTDLQRLGLAAEDVATHIIAATGAPANAGFHTVARYGTVEIRERLQGTPAVPPTMRQDLLRLPQPGVTDRLAPQVPPRAL